MDVALRIFVLNFYHAPMFLFVTSADKVMSGYSHTLIHYPIGLKTCTLVLLYSMCLLYVLVRVDSVFKSQC